MIARRNALLLMAVVFWEAWWLLASRVEDAASAAPLLIMAGAGFWMLRRDFSGTISIMPLALVMLLYAAVALVGPALAQIGVAVGATVVLTFHGGRRSPPRAPLIGLALLALPILPTLDFLLAYPLRRISAAITVALLRSNGITVRLEGIALDWHGRMLLFDAPCSGVRMLWTALLLVSLVSLIGRFDLWSYGRLLLLGVAMAVLGNALRAASLFYLENGRIALLKAPLMHEAVGLVAFLLLGAAIVAAAPRLWRRA